MPLNSHGRSRWLCLQDSGGGLQAEEGGYLGYYEHPAGSSSLGRGGWILNHGWGGVEGEPPVILRNPTISRIGSFLPLLTLGVVYPQ